MESVVVCRRNLPPGFTAAFCIFAFCRRKATTLTSQKRAYQKSDLGTMPKIESPHFNALRVEMKASCLFFRVHFGDLLLFRKACFDIALDLASDIFLACLLCLAQSAVKLRLHLRVFQDVVKGRCGLFRFLRVFLFIRLASSTCSSSFAVIISSAIVFSLPCPPRSSPTVSFCCI